MSLVLLTGATGHLGSAVLPRLLAAGHEVRTLSRTSSSPSPGATAFTGDLRLNTGLVEAVADVDAVVHCASDPRHPEADVTAAAHLIGALAQGSPDAHLVFVSIVGVDEIPLRYYGIKHEVERAVEASGMPWTVQRATQFHSFVDAMVGGLARLPVVPAPRGFAFQPVATEEVADVLVRHVDDGPAGRATDVGGPEVLAMADLVRTWLAAHGRRRPVLGVPVPGRLGGAFRAGVNTCPDGVRGRATWAEHLADVGD